MGKKKPRNKILRHNVRVRSRSTNGANGQSKATQRGLNYIMDEFVGNLIQSRQEFMKRLIDPRRDINAECGYPETSEITSADYKELFDREAIAARVVEVLPLECWQQSPSVYEDEDSKTITPFEKAWDDLSKSLRGTSWYKDEQGSPTWEYLKRLDIMSGIGHFGVLLLGFDDNKPLYMPVEFVDSKSTMLHKEQQKNRNKPNEPNLDATLGTEAQYYTLPGFEDTQIQYNERVDNYNHLARQCNVLEDPYELLNNFISSKQREVDKNKNGDKNGKPVNDEEILKQAILKQAIAQQQDVEPEEEKEDEQQLDTAHSPEAIIKGRDNAAQGEQETVEGEPITAEDQAVNPGNPEIEVKTVRKLLYARVFDESLVQITRYDSNKHSPRYGQPVMYMITLNDPTQSHGGIGLPLATVNVHWTRVIHIADNLNSSEVFGIPRMQSVYNRLADLVKLYGGSAEMYWRGAFPGLAFETHPQLGGEVEIDEDEMKEQIERYFNTMQRYLTAEGMSIHTISPTVVDPSLQIDTEITAICIRIGIPKRIFMGSERGELASGQDDTTWTQRVMERQANYITPRLIIPFVDRLIATGTLPEPTGYSVDWPDMEAASPEEEAALATAQIGAMAQYLASGIDSLISPLDFLTHILRMEEDDARKMLMATIEHLAMANPGADPTTIVPGHQPKMPTMMFDEQGNPVPVDPTMMGQLGQSAGQFGQQQQQQEEGEGEVDEERNNAAQGKTKKKLPAFMQNEWTGQRCAWYNDLTNNIIREIGNGKYRLYSRSGKNLGTFDSREAAEKHECEVEYFKHANNELNNLSDNSSDYVDNIAAANLAKEVAEYAYNLLEKAYEMYQKGKITKGQYQGLQEKFMEIIARTEHITEADHMRLRGYGDTLRKTSRSLGLNESTDFNINLLENYDPSQPRGYAGRWVDWAGHGKEGGYNRPRGVFVSDSNLPEGVKRNKRGQLIDSKGHFVKVDQLGGAAISQVYTKFPHLDPKHRIGKKLPSETRLKGKIAYGVAEATKLQTKKTVDELVDYTVKRIQRKIPKEERKPISATIKRKSKEFNSVILDSIGGAIKHHADEMLTSALLLGTTYALGKITGFKIVRGKAPKWIKTAKGAGKTATFKEIKQGIKGLNRGKIGKAIRRGTNWLRWLGAEAPKPIKSTKAGKSVKTAEPTFKGVDLDTILKGGHDLPPKGRYKAAPGGKPPKLIKGKEQYWSGATNELSMDEENQLVEVAGILAQWLMEYLQQDNAEQTENTFSDDPNDWDDMDFDVEHGPSIGWRELAREADDDIRAYEQSAKGHRIGPKGAKGSLETAEHLWEMAGYAAAACSLVIKSKAPKSVKAKYKSLLDKYSNLSEKHEHQVEQEKYYSKYAQNYDPDQPRDDSGQWKDWAGHGRGNISHRGSSTPRKRNDKEFTDQVADQIDEIIKEDIPKIAKVAALRAIFRGLGKIAGEGASLTAKTLYGAGEAFAGNEEYTGNYDPGQPRAPKGSDEGGQWVDQGSSTTTARVKPSKAKAKARKGGFAKTAAKYASRAAGFGAGGLLTAGTDILGQAVGTPVGAIAGGAIGSIFGPAGTAAGAWYGGGAGSFIGGAIGAGIGYTEGMKAAEVFGKEGVKGAQYGGLAGGLLGWHNWMKKGGTYSAAARQFKKARGTWSEEMEGVYQARKAARHGQHRPRSQGAGQQAAGNKQSARDKAYDEFFQKRAQQRSEQIHAGKAAYSKAKREAFVKSFGKLKEGSRLAEMARVSREHGLGEHFTTLWKQLTPSEKKTYTDWSARGVPLSE